MENKEVVMGIAIISIEKIVLYPMGKKGRHFSLKISDSVPSNGWKIFPHFKIDYQADTKNSIVKGNYLIPQLV
ncbi:unnamed protein product [Lupinus luteus]|uniref:Uncharacterized protein n=1 Tax=Lupinus luteus TaxID=3873 RepID=A0AAV1Y0I4_LUPLU